MPHRPKPLRIAHVCKSYSPTSETFIHDYVTGLRARPGLRCDVFAFRRVNVARRPLVNFHRVDPLPAATPSGLAARALDLVSTPPHEEPRPRAVAMHRALRRFAPDVVHAHFGPNGAMVAGATGAPLIVSYHGYDISELLGQPVWMERYRRLWRRAAAVTVVSHLQRRVITEAGCPPGKVHVVRVGKRLDELAFAPPQAPARRFICVGRFAEKKAHLDTVRAIESARAAGHPVSLQIIGGGARFARVESYVAERGLGEYVELLGERPFAEVIARMRQADAFMLSSKTARNGDQEGVPTVLMEAQALGLPCVSTRHAGIPEVIPEANQWALAPEGDIEGLAERVVRMAGLGQEELTAQAERGRARVEEEFDLVAQIDRLERLYRSLV